MSLVLRVQRRRRVQASRSYGRKESTLFYSINFYASRILETNQNRGYIHLQISDQRALLLQQKLGDFTSERLINRAGIWIKGPADESFREVHPKPNSRALYASLSVNEHFLPLHLLDYDKRGLHISVKSRSRRVNKVKCYVLEVRQYISGAADPLIRSYYIGKEDYLIHRVEELNRTTECSNYIAVDGIMVPHLQVQKSATSQGLRGRSSRAEIRLHLKQIELNPRLSEDVFRPFE